MDGRVAWEYKADEIVLHAGEILCKRVNLEIWRVLSRWEGIKVFTEDGQQVRGVKEDDDECEKAILILNRHEAVEKGQLKDWLRQYDMGNIVEKEEFVFYLPALLNDGDLAGIRTRALRLSTSDINQSGLKEYHIADTVTIETSPCFLIMPMNAKSMAAILALIKLEQFLFSIEEPWTAMAKKKMIENWSVKQSPLK